MKPKGFNDENKNMDVYLFNIGKWRVYYKNNIKNTSKNVLEKNSRSNIPYLKTISSKQVENTKAFELTIIKELGKFTP
jgi:hypothetical protein